MTHFKVLFMPLYHYSTPKLIYILDTHGPFLLQDMLMGDEALIKILDNSIALGVLLTVGFFFFRDYQKRMAAMDLRLASQEELHRKLTAEKDTKTMDLMLATQNTVSGLSKLVEQQSADYSRKEQESQQLLQRIAGALDKQATVLEAFIQYNRKP